MSPQYMCIPSYVKLIWCNGTPYIYCELEWGGRCMLSICAFCIICETYGGVTWYSIYLMSIGVGVRCMLSICAFCYI